MHGRAFSFSGLSKGGPSTYVKSGRLPIRNWRGMRTTPRGAGRTNFSQSGPSTDSGASKTTSVAALYGMNAMSTSGSDRRLVFWPPCLMGSGTLPRLCRSTPLGCDQRGAIWQHNATWAQACPHDGRHEWLDHSPTAQLPAWHIFPLKNTEARQAGPG